MWRQPITWRKAHPARGMFGPTQEGMREVLRVPVFIHPCEVCDNPNAPFGIHGLWYCKEHNPK